MDIKLMTDPKLSSETGSEMDNPLGNQDLPVSNPALNERDLERAEQILKLINEDPHPNQVVGNNLDEILGILPAILSANIRQATLEGKSGLVHSLEDLLEEYQPHITEAPEASITMGPWQSKSLSSHPRILFVGPDNESTEYRLECTATILESLGCQTFTTSTFPPDLFKNFDMVFVSRPHLNPDYLIGMAACRANNIPVIIDIDMDYKSIPVRHPEYEQLSLLEKDIAQAYTTGILLADQIISPSRELVNHLRAEGFTTYYAPPGWNNDNPLWSKPAPARHTINIGWLGRPGHLEDFARIRRTLNRILRQVPQTKLVIGSNPEAYHLFKNIPDSRKLYLPPSRLEDFPYSLGQIDILVSPLRNNPFNRSHSDRLLMEAGARAIPWIAPPIPSFKEWNAGGLFAKSVGEWYTHLYQLVINSELRKQLGQEGYQKAQEREIHQLAPVYMDLIDLFRWSKDSEREDQNQVEESND